LVAQALERDPDFDFIAPVRDAAARLEDVVGTQVRLFPADHGAADESAGGDVGAFDHRAIPLHTEGVDGEHQRLFAVVEVPSRIWTLSSPKI
jgi:hypothetical protein